MIRRSICLQIRSLERDRRKDSVLAHRLLYIRAESVKTEATSKKQ